MSRLDGAVAVVTGGAIGIGYAIAEELGAAGARIAILDFNSEGGVRAAARLAASGIQTRAYPVDVSDSAQVDEAFEAVHRDFSGLDIVVNNAGVSLIGPYIHEMTDESWHRSVAVMQDGVFYSMRAAARYMLPRRSGSVVNISSIRGLTSNPGRIAYCASKAAVIMMTRVAASEWAPYGVRCNAIAPGVQKTPMWDEDVRLGVIDEQHVLDVTPAGRLGDPHEIGRLAVYLSSDDASYINGSCITIDGGLTSMPIEGSLRRPGQVAPPKPTPESLPTDLEFP